MNPGIAQPICHPVGTFGVVPKGQDGAVSSYDANVRDVIVSDVDQLAPTLVVIPPHETQSELMD